MRKENNNEIKENIKKGAEALAEIILGSRAQDKEVKSVAVDAILDWNSKRA